LFVYLFVYLFIYLFIVGLDLIRTSQSLTSWRLIYIPLVLGTVCFGRSYVS